MTVSPRRVQDGSRHTPDEPSGFEKQEPATPPTLFELRNLGKRADNDAQPTTCETTKDVSPTVDPVNDAPDETPRSSRRASLIEQAESKAEAEQALPQLTKDVQPTNDRGTSKASTPPAPAPPNDTILEPLDQLPAGRTWMEKIGSHALVLAMLLIVVAAAFLTGNGKDNQQYDDSVADTITELDFDLGENAELPIPEHDHGAPSSDITVAEAESDSLSQIGNSNVMAANELDSAVALSEPVIDVDLDVETNLPEATDALKSERTEAVAVSNRLDASTIPTLEDLESTGVVEVAKPATSNASAFKGPAFSKTPFGISFELEAALQTLDSFQTVGTEAVDAPNPQN